MGDELTYDEVLDKYHDNTHGIGERQLCTEEPCFSLRGCEPQDEVVSVLSYNLGEVELEADELRKQVEDLQQELDKSAVAHRALGALQELRRALVAINNMEVPSDHGTPSPSRQGDTSPTSSSPE